MSESTNKSEDKSFLQNMLTLLLNKEAQEVGQLNGTRQCIARISEGLAELKSE